MIFYQVKFADKDLEVYSMLGEARQKAREYFMLTGLKAEVIENRTVKRTVFEAGYKL